MKNIVNIKVKGGNVFTVFYLPGPSLLMETQQTLHEDCLKLSAGCSPKYAYIYIRLSVCPLPRQDQPHPPRGSGVSDSDITRPCPSKVCGWVTLLCPPRCLRQRPGAGRSGTTCDSPSARRVSTFVRKKSVRKE